MREPVIIGDATLYLGDAREIVPALGHVDLVFADPPYGVSGVQNTKTAKARTGPKNAYLSFSDSVVSVSESIVPAIELAIKRYGRAVVTPGNRCLTLYPMPNSFGAIWQPASVGLQAWGRADAQPILYYGKSPYGGTELPGKKCSFQSTSAAEQNGHPCPKPIDLMKAILANSSKHGETVLDPFMGSGTTGVACAKMGRRFIGIEIEPKYFDIACKRIEAAYAAPDLFVAPPAAPKQDAFNV